MDTRPIGVFDSGLGGLTALWELRRLMRDILDYLGLPHELNVRLGPLPEDNLANYDDKTHVVTVNIDHIEYDPPEDILDSVCHESYHAQQRRACEAYETIPDEYRDLMAFYTLQVYTEEFAHYIGDNTEEYYDQLVEKHARADGAASVKDYYQHIYEYLGKEYPEDNDVS